ncbi:hypothetical protein HanRHA438_Chr01g0038341 [Helianthus annuus]|uniref:DC1 domain-containing protein n=1 Tax=Helianthus annuus TaxID=4232 RepID=A0A251VR26_HELAN|nr:hypothetical protein HanHA300_Chr01g0030461 [Helianthus annuus]KAJ0628081.1 hypothetical protein HanHA89_Chr01g0032841 [Helianthus annuus]KAJ0784369.1 hypothetical protein HanLR1_Chr01g0031341 [Helianthus annuus]KAJ0793581.1 hypothetical protein HanOQP8_Chr01g0030991 [Helianthus annuus]KAJ0793583.1 hypothetical protein HanOQP8_Chr01g0031011 [Helianthus annuus]
MVTVIEHDHPLKLIDLQVNDEDVEEAEADEEEEKDVVIQKDFVCPCKCKRCDQPIHEYYRYYYKCVDDSCDYFAHKFCVEIPTHITPTIIKHISLPYSLKLQPIWWNWPCEYCHTRHPHEVCYADMHHIFKVCVSSVTEVDKKGIHHPSHPHPLMPLMLLKPILCECKACSREHKGLFFMCTTCPDFAIHSDCAFLPKRSLIQQTTGDIFHHTHPLTLSFSFPEAEQRAKYNPKCRVCNHNFYDERIWIYKCEKCIYYVHAYCATSREEPFMHILLTSK